MYQELRHVFGVAIGTASLSLGAAGVVSDRITWPSLIAGAYCLYAAGGANEAIAAKPPREVEMRAIKKPPESAASNPEALADFWLLAVRCTGRASSIASATPSA